jgi:glycosyltransferase involved in cell wall biosynthesis
MEKTAIILITKNRINLLKQTIFSLIENTPKELYDLMVVDDGSDIDCTQFLKGLFDSGKISDLIFTKFGSPSRCRNLGAEIAKKKGYKYLYHTDNDMYFLPNWLESCYNIIGHKEIIIIGPYCHPFLQKNNDKNFESINVETVDAVSGNSWFISTENYFSYGLHETDGIMNSEDWEMCQRIRKDGNFVVRLLPHKVLHCGVCNSRGEASVGAEIMIEELGQAKVKHKLNNLIYE